MDQNKELEELEELVELVEEVDNEFNPYLGEILSDSLRGSSGKVGHC